MTLYVVHYQVGGYAREDASTTKIAGVYSDAKVAEYVKRACGGDVTEVEVDKIHMGFVAHLNELGIKIDTSGRIKQ